MIRFLVKGLLRDRSRSVFRLLMVAAGVFLTVFMYGFMKGALSDIIDTNARFNEGHLKVMTNAYSKKKQQVPNDQAFLGVEGLLSELEKGWSEYLWVARIKFSGLLDIPDERGETRVQGPVNCYGLEIYREKKILGLEKALVEGQLPSEYGDLLVSKDLSEKLGVGVAQRATIIGSTIHGAMSVYNFRVTGIIRFGISAMDRATVIMGLDNARDVLDMPGGSSEILGFSKDLMYRQYEMFRVAEDFNRKFFKEKDEFSPVMETLAQQAGMGEYLDMVKYWGGIMVTVFVLAMSMVLWNAGLMDGIRRYGEIGVRLAIGESKNEVYFSMILESIAVGVAGCVLGTLLGLAATYYMQKVGINIEYALENSTLKISNVIRARVTPLGCIVGFIPGLLASVAGTMFAGIGIYKRQLSRLFSELER